MSAPIVVLRPEDAGRMAMLHLESFVDPWSAVYLRGLLLKREVLALGIEVDGALAAFALVQTIAGESDILTIATHPHYRRQGHGGALLRSLLKRLGERGIRRITLDVAEDNAAARALYAQFGFGVDGRRPGYYRQNRATPVDGLLMSKTVEI